MSFALDHIVIYASNREKSGRFYARLLGMLGFEEGRGGVFVRDGLFFDIRAKGNGAGDAAPRQCGDPGVDRIGFKASSSEAVDAIKDEMDAAGFNGELFEFHLGDRALFLPDPDGVRIRITWYANPPAAPVD